MNRDINILEQIDLYLEGKMSKVASEDFEERMKTDNKLSDLIQSQKLSHQIILGSRLNNLKMMMDQDFDSGKVNNHKGNLKWWITGMSMFTALVIVFVINVNHINPVKENISTLDDKSVQTPLKVKETAPVIWKTDIDMVKNVKRGSEKESSHLIDEKSDFPMKEDEKTIETVLIPVQENKKEGLTLESINKKSETETIVKDKEVQEKNTVIEKEAEVISHEPVAKKSNSYSFNPGFGEVFQIPLEAGAEAEIKIMNRAGVLVYSEKVYGDHNNTWDGRNINGGISSPDLYIYILEYKDGKKETGQIIIY